MILLRVEVRKRYFQEFVFPSIRQTSGELFLGVTSKALHFVDRRSKILGKASGDSLLWKEFFDAFAESSFPIGQFCGD